MIPTILLISNEPIGPTMAGPAIRYWEFAKTLGRIFRVILAVPPHHAPQPLPHPVDFAVCFCGDVATLKRLTHQADVIITVGANLSVYPFLQQTGKPLVVDMYIPSILEGLQKHQPYPLTMQLASHRQWWRIHHDQIRAADFILCASEKQRDYWLGWLTALGRVNPYTHQADASLHQLIEVVPFGLPDSPPPAHQAVLKGVHPAIGAQDKLILWGGGLWNWLDWRTALEAVALLRREGVSVKLFFMGVKPPQSPPMEAVAQARAYRDALGLSEEQVIFNDWVPYQQRHNYLLEADIGLSLHVDHLETRFSFRTRLLDYIWCGLPIVATEGDVLSDEVKRLGVGVTVRASSAADLAETLQSLLKDQNLRQRYQPHFEQARQQYQWSEVLQPLIQFCHAPYHAADYHHKISPLLSSPMALWSHKIRLAWQHGGLPELFQQTRQYLRWKRQQ